MIDALRRWIRGDNAADQRIKALESELAAARMCVATGRDVYLKRLARCRRCATCNPELGSFTGMPDYELGEPS